MLPWRALLATRAPLGARDLLARMLSNKRHSGAKKRFRATQRGAIKRKAAGMGHNTGLRRQHRQTRPGAAALIFDADGARPCLRDATRGHGAGSQYAGVAQRRSSAA